MPRSARCSWFAPAGKAGAASPSSAPSRRRPSFGQMIGLHESADSLELKSGVALVLDQDTNEVLFSKNSAGRPADRLAHQADDRPGRHRGASSRSTKSLTITEDDIDTEKGSRSRLRVGTQLRREEMLHLALMSSENRAAHALGRTIRAAWPHSSRR